MSRSKPSPIIVMSTGNLRVGFRIVEGDREGKSAGYRVIKGMVRGFRSIGLEWSTDGGKTFERISCDEFIYDTRKQAASVARGYDEPVEDWYD